jgi:GrpB-like predicted nucleotidyltransferase (UPF0157 family)
MKQKTELLGGIEKRNIEIVDYEPTWPEKFQQHYALIVAAIKGKAIRIEHIGSTSVPGLAAKPIIDILLAVQNSTDEDSYLPQLQMAGYELRVREPEFYEHRMLRTPARDVHIHIFSPGSPEIERYLLFRDRLRIDAHDRQRYEETKRNLAKQSWPDMNAYAEAKSEIVERIIATARRSSTTT